VNLVTKHLGSTFLFIALHDEGPPTIIGLGAPIRAQIKAQVGRWVNSVEINLIGVSSIRSCMTMRSKAHGTPYMDISMKKHIKL